MLVATAGHIDHGKTSLIRALTGVETDRLPEERARGISIDLGFAYWRPDEGETIGFVDVPGHERFVRNMLAGVAAIDLALIVIAADDGVMPQSVEHVQILDLLGVKRGLVAITKCDRASAERIAMVREQVQATLRPTAMAGAPMFEVSALTGQGVKALGEALMQARSQKPERPAADRLFRLAVDRAFTVAGAGTVATGTVFDGAVQVGDRLVLSPHGLDVRVRGIQSGGRPTDRAQAGERCALNLAGVELGQVHRGDWLLAPELHAPTARLAVRLKSLIGALKHNAPAHLHLGATDVEARVLIPGLGGLAPGGQAVAYLSLTAPTTALTGDRFVLRDASGQRTLGGGQVIDPFVDADRRGRALRDQILAAMQAQGPAEALAALLAIPGHELDPARFERSFGLAAQAAARLYDEADAVTIGAPRPLVLPRARAEAIKQGMLDALKAFHAEHPDQGGLAPRDLKARLSEPVSPEAVLALQKQLADERLIETRGALISLAGHRASLSSGDEILWRRLLDIVETRGELAFTAPDLALELRTSEPVVKALLHRMRANGEVWRINEKRFVLRAHIAGLAASAAEVAKTVGGKGFTAAQYRDAIGTGRTLAIQILEFFDSIGVTGRNGDLRRVRSDYALMVGAAEPYRAGD